MSVQANGQTLVPGTPVQLMTPLGTSSHAWVDLTVSNTDTADTDIKVWITANSSPNSSDIFVPETHLRLNERILRNCFMVKSGEKLYVSSTGDGSVARFYSQEMETSEAVVDSYNTELGAGAPVEVAHLHATSESGDVSLYINNNSFNRADITVYISVNAPTNDNVIVPLVELKPGESENELCIGLKQGEKVWVKSSVPGVNVRATTNETVAV